MFNDKKILHRLSKIKTHNFEAFMSLKQNIEAIYLHLLRNEADNAYYNRDNSTHDVYRLDKRAYTVIATYLNINHFSPTECYLVFIHCDFASVYFINNHGQFYFRKDLTCTEDVHDLLETFQKYLVPLNNCFINREEFYEA